MGAEKQVINALKPCHFDANPMLQTAKSGGILDVKNKASSAESVGGLLGFPWIWRRISRGFGTWDTAM